MFRNVFTKTLRDQYRALIGWGVGFVALVAIMAALWPSIRDMPDIEKLLDNYPEAMRKLFDIDAITTGGGYLNAELFTFMLPVMFIVYGIGRGARSIAGEEQASTLDVLLSTPVSRRRILLHKAGALVVSTIVLGVIVFAVTGVSSVLASMDIAPAQLAAAAVAMVLLGIEYGLIALAVGAATGRRGLSIAVAGSMATAAYVLYVIGALVDQVRPWRVVSPFNQALEAGPIGGGMPLAFLWLVAGALAVVVAAVPLFDRRDVNA